jgi:hypothetical protein
MSSRFGCRPRLVASGVGPRTLTVTATDPQGLTSTDSVDVTVADCGAGNCAPTAIFSLSPPTEPTLDAYFIEHAMQLELELGDAEVNNPITYRLTARRSGEPTVVITEGSVSVFDSHRPSSARSSGRPRTTSWAGRCAPGHRSIAATSSCSKPPTRRARARRPRSRSRSAATSSEHARSVARSGRHRAILVG